MRRQLLIAVTSCFWMAVLPSVRGQMASSDPASNPNFVLILTDDQRWDTIGRCLDGFDGSILAAGSDACMPFLQQDLIAHGTTFLRGYVTTALCCPSRASILKGQYSVNTGVVDNNGLPFFDDSSTIATWLDGAGYRTGLFGKYLNGWGPSAAAATEIPPGWDSWHVVYGEGGTLTQYTLQEADPGTVPSLATYDDSASTSGAACAEGNLYLLDLLCARAGDFLAAEATSPFFLFFSPPAPHLPAVAPSRWVGTYSSVAPPMYPNFNVIPSPNPPSWLRPMPLTSVQLSTIADEFRRQLDTNRAVDDAIHALYQRLEADGRLSNTVFVFLSDNGLARAEHRHDRKSCEYEECHRVPFVVVCPPAVCSGAAPGSVDVDHFALNIDIAPTLAALAGVTPPLAVDGTSLVPILNDPSAISRSHFFIDDMSPKFGGLDGVLAVASDGHLYKYVKFRDNTDAELYDLTTDPWELSNLVNDGLHGAVQASLAALLSGAGAPDTIPPPPPTFTSTPTDPSGPSVTFSFTDAEPGVTFSCELDGGGSAPCTSPTSHVGLPVGTRTFSVAAVDAAGNSSDPSTFSWTVSGGDVIPPTVTMKQPKADALVRVTKVKASWSGADDTGISRYDVYERIGVAGAQLLAQASLATSYQRSGMPGTTYCYQVIALDTAGNAGSGPELCAAVPVDDADPSIVYTGQDSHLAASAAFLGTLSVLDALGEQAEMAFTGRKVGVLVRKDAFSGKLQVYVDGTLVQEVDLFASSPKDKIYVFTRTLSPGPHVIRLVWAGTKNPASDGTSVSLDGIAFVG
jgi:arylsulfatase A-like enzyme